MGRVKVNTFPRPIWVEVDREELLHLDPSPDHVNLFQLERFVCSWLALLGDSPFRSDAPTPREVRAFKRLILTRGIKEVIVDLLDAATQLTSSIFVSPDGTTTTGPGLRILLKSPISRTYIWFLETGDLSVLPYILTFLWFGRKLPWDDPAFHTTAFRKWLKVEEKLSALQIPSSLMIRMRNIITSLELNWERTEFWPKHGPGSVFEGTRDPALKSRFMGRDDKLVRAFLTGYYAQRETLGGYSVDIRTLRGSILSKMDSPSSMMIFVDKDMRSSRTICKETAQRMYYQQGLMRSLISNMGKGPLGRHVRLDDQSYNRDLALMGSDTCLYDTIDLSSASDSVSIDLVRGIFPRHILYYLLATRSSSVVVGNDDIDGVPQGTTIQVKKFAPMGSALCFPIQCIIFSAAVILASIAEVAPETAPEDYTYATYSRLGILPFAVYGDDIVCDSRISRTLVHVLGALGFSVNTEKSAFGPMAFRESCGGYYIAGYDVTPYLYKIANRDLTTAEGLFSHVEHVNLAGDKKLRNLQRFLISQLRNHSDRRVRSILFTDDRTRTFCIYSTRPRNTHLKREYNADWQIVTIRCSTPLPEDCTDYSDDLTYHEYRYLRWWATRHGGNCNDSVSTISFRLTEEGSVSHTYINEYLDDGVSVGRSPWEVRGDTRLGWGWTPIRG